MTEYYYRDKSIRSPWRQCDAAVFAILRDSMEKPTKFDGMQIAARHLGPIPPQGNDANVDPVSPAEIEALMSDLSLPGEKLTIASQLTPEDEANIDKAWSHVTDSEWVKPAMAEQAEALNDAIDLCEGQTKTDAADERG